MVRVRALIGIFLAFSLAAAPLARAEVGASGTRIAVAGGSPRFYMTYGHPDEPELYAPIIQELARVRVTFERNGDEFRVFYKGARIGEWPTVRSREQVPETGEEPCVLEMGGSLYVPVRKLAELVPIDVKWDKRSNLLGVVPGQPGTKAAGFPARPGAPALQSDLIALTAVEVTEEGGAVQVRIRSNGAVHPTWTMARSPLPVRIVMDFPGAGWAEGIQVPVGVGNVREVRVGKFTPTTARLVLEVPSPQVRLTGLKAAGNDLSP